MYQDNMRQGLYDPSLEHDNCGIGAVVNIKGLKSHETVSNALKIVENLEHRAGKDAEGKTGDGVGILVQISHKFFEKTCSTLGFSIGKERDYGIGMFFMPQEGRVKLPWLERSSDSTGHSWKESGRLYAMYHAGVCKETI